MARKWFVAGCIVTLLLGPIVAHAQQTRTFRPQEIGLRSISSNHSEGPCFGLPLGGIVRDRIFTDYQAIASRLTDYPVGLVNIMRPGADPAPCNRWQNDVLQAALRFNLESIPVRSTVTRARLVWNMAPFTLGSLPADAQRRPFRSCTNFGFVVGEAWRAWPRGFTSRRTPWECGDRNDLRGCVSRGPPYTSDFLPFRFAVDTVRPALQFQNGGQVVTLNVRNAARRWVFHPPSNHGFIVSPYAPPAMTRTVAAGTASDGLRHLNCVRILRDPRLQVTWRPWD